jgi:nucleotide-binding universal stress UspA family protein
MSGFTPGDSPYQRILFCTDFSENADFAFDYAIDSAVRRPGCTFYLLHVIPEPDAQFWKNYLYEVDDVDNKAKHDIDARLAESYLNRVPKDVDLQVEMRVGQDSQEILAFAREKNIDLIIIGRQGRSSLGKVLFGNVTEKITRKADCAVLVIPLSFRPKADGADS